MCLTPLSLALALLGACPAEEGSSTATSPAANTTAAPSDAPAGTAPTVAPPTEPAPSPSADDDEPLGRVLGGPLPIEGLLGKPAAEVEAQLAEPLGKGMARNSCVRYLPERTWFECKFAIQRYGDKTGAYSAIGVEYQDGISTAVTFEGPKQMTGAFDARAALAAVGLELPGEPTIETQGDATVHSWFNAAARLRIHGREYRVVVSSVANDWARSKIEVILNDPLDASERTRVVNRSASGE